MIRILSLIALTGLFLFTSCGPKGTNANDGLASFNKDSLAHQIQILSSDEFEGRRPFSKGETLTVNYLAKTFARLGLEPANGNSFFQEVPMVEIICQPDATMKVEGSKGKFELKNMDDYVMWTENPVNEVSLNRDEVVFAGFGIVAPEYNWNDYAGLDVKGKVVLVMVNDPGLDSNDSTFFKGATMTYYGRWTYKYEEASRQGAKGCLIIHNTRAASYPFDVVRNSWGKSQIHLDSRGSTAYRCPVEGWLTGDAAKKLLTAATGDTSLLSKAVQKGFKPVPLGLKVSTTIKAKSVFSTSKNVAGKITGTKRPDEYLVFTAHWDHFGIGKPDEAGDSIYNGAVDNASGTAALIEVARAFQSMETRPERSVIFLSVTAEEQGLLGSAYYAQHPLFPIKKTVADINIDGINITGTTKDIVVSGAGQSELETYLKEEASRHGRYISPELHPEAGHYFRSDHFNFAKVGVPALTTAGGTDNVAHGKSYGQKLEDEYTAKYYHRPSDEYDAATWNLDGGIEDIQLLFTVGKRVANESTWPKWNENSEFKSLR